VLEPKSAISWPAQAPAGVLNAHDRIRRDRKWCPVSQTKLLETLEQPAVDEDAVFARFKKVS